MSVSEAQSLSELGKAALAIAHDGHKVFPCVPNGKEPATAHGYKDASSDPEQIKAWWTKDPNANIGFCPEDASLCVIDIDPGASPGEIAKFPPTYTVQTPRGGKHFYFDGSLPPSAGKLAPNIDTRGRRSYVLLPPSIVNGKGYKTIDERNPVPVPQWIVDCLAKGETIREQLTDKLDLEVNLARARGYIANQAKATIPDGQRNDKCFNIAAELFDLGLSYDTALALMADFNAKVCNPPLSERELVTTVNSARTNRQNPIGSKASTGNPEEVFAAADLPKVDAPSVVPALASRYGFVDPVKEANRAPIEYWDANKQFPRSPEGSTCIVYGDTGVFKTSFVLSIALEALFNHPSKPKVAFFAGEGPFALGQSRIPAACRHLGQSVEALRDSGRWGKANVAPLLNNQADIDTVRDQLNAFKPNIIVIETLSRALAGQNLSDTQVITRALQVADEMHTRHRALVIITHHQGKDEGRGATGSKFITAMPDTVLHIAKVDNDTIRVRVEKQRDGQDDFTVGYRVVRENGVPAFLTALSFAETKATDKKAKASSNDNADRKARYDAMIERGMFGADRALTTAEFVRALAGQEPSKHTDLHDAWEIRYARLKKDLENGSRAVVANPKYVGLFERLPRGQGGKPIVMWFLPYAEKERLERAQATAAEVLAG